MNKNLMLNQEELIVCKSAVETLMESNMPVLGISLREELKQDLCVSSLKKLNSYSIFTCFSKQEYTVIAMALYHMQECSEAIGICLDNAFFSALEKISSLAEPSQSPFDQN